MAAGHLRRCENAE